jgi:sec-independent protein translocase protein TatB
VFGIDSSELMVVALVALLVIGPKDLPRVMRQVGQWMAKGRAMTRHVRAGFDTMMREAELEEMQKAWAAQNDAIMKATALPDLGIKNPLPDLGAATGSDDWMLPPPPLAPEIVDIAPAVEAPAAVPKRRRKPAGDAPAATAPATKSPRKRVAKKPLPEPQSPEPQSTES